MSCSGFQRACGGADNDNSYLDPAIFAIWISLVAIFIGLSAYLFSPALGQAASVKVDEPRMARGVEVFDLVQQAVEKHTPHERLILSAHQ